MADPSDDEHADDSITCSVCLDVFKSPKVLPCGHSFCQEPCLSNLTNSRKHKKIHCPLCRIRISLPKSGQAKDFPTNYSLQFILDSRGKKKELKRSHSNGGTAKRPLDDPVPQPCAHLQTAEFYCEQCEQFLCPKCAASFHGNQGEHSIIAKDTALERARAQSENMVSDMIARLEQRIMRQSELLEEAKISFIDYDIRVSCLKDEVIRAMDSARKEIDKREQDYNTEITIQTDAEKFSFSEFTRKWETSRAADEKMLENMKATRVQVQAGNLTQMNQVMSVGPIDVTCSEMVKQTAGIAKAPPFTLINGSPDELPRIRKTCDVAFHARLENSLP